MRDDKVEWDDAKAQSNRLNHAGVTFEQARLVFDDIYAVEYEDDREDYGEERTNRIGYSGGVLLPVTYTMRGHRKRLISARRAEAHEADSYFTRNEP